MTTTAAGGVRFLDELPRDSAEFGLGVGMVLVYDRKLDDIPLFDTWKRIFPLRYPVPGGESLKEVAAFPTHMESILDLVSGAARSEVTIVAAGGGSVGDFGGFVASVLQRGVALINMPTTWLAAMDSAHGGKTALNVGGFKNQIGTFHPAAEVWIARPLLDALPAAEASAAAGELLKMAMLTGGDLFEGVAAASSIGPDELWALLPGAIAGKRAVVVADPIETKGHRQVLNLGHTLGHALEAHYRLPHGVAVGCGLRFAIEWSRGRAVLGDTEMKRMLAVLEEYPEFRPEALPEDPRLDESRLATLLTRDKKSLGSGRVRFVFLESVGTPLLEDVAIDEVLVEATRQGWL